MPTKAGKKAFLPSLMVHVQHANQLSISFFRDERVQSLIYAIQGRVKITTNIVFFVFPIEDLVGKLAQ